VSNSHAANSPSEGEPGRAEWLRQLAAELSAAGLRAHVHDTRSLLDLTAAVPASGGKAPDVVVDTDGYTEVRFWQDADSTPAQAAAVITRTLAAITVFQRP
jgi:hypothetical protein